MRPMPEVVFDCCVISNFSLSGSLAVLRSLYGGASYMTDFVWAEILRGIQKGYGGLMPVKEALKDGWLIETTLNTAEERAMLETLSVSLGFGEASSIAVAKAKSFMFACDDKVAGKEAGLLGIKLTGTIGILTKAVRTKIVDLNTADRHLNKMIAFGFYSPIASIKKIMS